MLHVLSYSLSSQYAGFVNDKVHVQSAPAELDYRARQKENRRTNAASTAKGSWDTPVKEWGNRPDH